MIFVKNEIGESNLLTGWTSCSNCGYNNSSPPSADYQSRSSATASEKNAANNGKSCVSG